MIRCGCGHAFDDALGKYGCPNCNGDEANREGTMSTETTTATRISEQLGNDGQVFEDVDGRYLSDICAEEPGVLIEWRDGFRTGDVVRYVFADDSVITIAGDGWDFGYVDCFCWQGVGHSDDCAAQDDEEEE